MSTNSGSVDRSAIAKDWHARGFSCGLWIDHSGREWSYQAHETDELFMVMSGKLELELAGQTIQPVIGAEIRIPAGMPHSIRTIEGKTVRWLYGQIQEHTTIDQFLAPASHVRSFHPEVKRKRIPGKIVPPLDVSKPSNTHPLR